MKLSSPRSGAFLFVLLLLAGLTASQSRPSQAGPPSRPNVLFILADDLGWGDVGYHDPAYLPEQRGFDHFYGLYTGQFDYFTHTYCGGLDWHRDGHAVREEGYSTDLLGQDAVQFLQTQDPSQPFFLELAFNAPHTPLE